MKNDSNLNSPILGNESGYLIRHETLMMGFARTMYFSKNEQQIYEIVDKATSKNNNGFFEEKLPDGVLSGNYAKSLQNGIQFGVFDEKTLQKGAKPETLDEIAISGTLANELGIKDTGETIFVTTPRKEVITNNGGLISDYAVSVLKVTGIVKSNKNAIYHYKNWTTLFYQCKIGVSAFELQTTSVAFSLNDSKLINESVKLFKRGFPDYNCVNPLSDVNDSVDTVCFYITIVLIVFSFVATLISVLLLTICNYLFILEGRKEIALARCLGVNKKESRKFLYYHSLTQCLISFVVASVELFLFSIAANFEVGSALSMNFHFSFNPIAFLPMLILSLSIALISSSIMSRRINKINPIEALTQ
jgi:ABC-type antimicrobial peptide transport system permease subunit